MMHDWYYDKKPSTRETLKEAQDDLIFWESMVVKYKDRKCSRMLKQLESICRDASSHAWSEKWELEKAVKNDKSISL